MGKKAERAEKIMRHGWRLLRIFPKSGYAGSPVSLYERLHRLEAEAHTLAERGCNEQLPDEYEARKEASILKRLDAILKFKDADIPVFLNGDPRGYALKIEDAYVKEHNLDIERDWGGYGILCPEF